MGDGMKNRGMGREATRGMLSNWLMTTVCPSGRIRPVYLFICISTAFDEKERWLSKGRWCLSKE